MLHLHPHGAANGRAAGQSAQRGHPLSRGYAFSYLQLYRLSLVETKPLKEKQSFPATYFLFCPKRTDVVCKRSHKILRQHIALGGGGGIAHNIRADILIGVQDVKYAQF